MSRITVVEGDITRLDVEAIVNAANSALSRGGGVCGAIHSAAGFELGQACATIGGCPVGEARLTRGFELRAKFVIHAVGPCWSGGGDNEAELLASAYRESLRVAAEAGVRSIGFPCISTGIFGYPADEAARIAVETMRAWEDALPERMVCCCFVREDAQRYRALLDMTE